jgi:hypothetical protein
MVAAVVCGGALALEHRKRVVYHRDRVRAARKPDSLEPVSLNLGESPRHLLLVVRENVDGEMRARDDHVVHRRDFLDANEDERRVEADGAKCARCHSVIGSVIGARRHDGDA